jgi:hypothetical protein
MMQPKDIMMFVAVAMLVGTIVSMTIAGVVAAQTENSSNNDNNIDTNNCQEINAAGFDAESATAAASDSETGEIEDEDEPGDIDVNDEEDTDTDNEDAGEANDEEQSGGSIASTYANSNVAGTNDQVSFDPCNISNEIVNNLSTNTGSTFVASRQALGGPYSIV